MTTFLRGLRYRGDDHGPLLMALAFAVAFVGVALSEHLPWWVALVAAAPWPGLWAFGVYDQGKHGPDNRESA